MHRMDGDGGIWILMGRNGGGAIDGMEGKQGKCMMMEF